MNITLATVVPSELASMPDPRPAPRRQRRRGRCQQEQWQPFTQPRQRRPVQADSQRDRPNGDTQVGNQVPIRETAPGPATELDVMARHGTPEREADCMLER